MGRKRYDVDRERKLKRKRLKRKIEELKGNAPEEEESRKKDEVKYKT